MFRKSPLFPVEVMRYDDGVVNDVGNRQDNGKNEIWVHVFSMNIKICISMILQRNARNIKP